MKKFVELPQISCFYPYSKTNAYLAKRYQIMKHNFYLLYLLFFVQITLFGQTVPTTLSEGAPASAGMSATQLSLMDDVINRYIDNKWVPGGVFLVARKGKIVYFKSFGNRTDQRRDAYDKDDIFRIASMTKAVTTVSIMQLYEQGKIGLDDPVSRFIPAFMDMKVLNTVNKEDTSYTMAPAKSPITIRQLLTHTSGITYGDSPELSIVFKKNKMISGGLSNPESTSEAYINQLAAMPLAFQPGEKYQYGLNMDVLGRVVEVVSGKSLSTYFQENIFEPLGMGNTYFYLPRKLQKNLVPVYTESEEEGLVLAEETATNNLDYPTNPDHPFYAGGGGLSSTALDYAIFIQALLNGGTYNGKRILGKKTIDVMTADQMIALNNEGQGFSKRPGETYGLGFALLTEEGAGINAKSPGTYEWGGYFNTKFFIDPAAEMIFVGMTQIVPFSHGEFWDRLYAIMYGAIEE